MSQEHADHVLKAQRQGHGAGHDYDRGSPHLRHPGLRGMVETRLEETLRAVATAGGPLRVLEVGAGHGTFTHTLLDLGAEVTVTEASPASAHHLRTTFAEHERLRVFDDPTGEAVFELQEAWDAAVVISVLHHIPDYLRFLTRLMEHLSPDGVLFMAQDPLYYPRMPRNTRRLDRAAFLAWRAVQGDYARGAATLLRRLRGIYDDSEPSDLIEYHVVRDGVDDEAIEALLAPHFERVEVFRYWSTQAPLLQRLGERTGMTTDFGVAAIGHKVD